MILITDRDIEPTRDLPIAMRAVRTTLKEIVDHSAEPLTRIHLGEGEPSLAITPGILRGMGTSGARITPGAHGGDSLVSVWDIVSGQLSSIVVGRVLSVLRTAAIGGVALETYTRAEEQEVAVIGTGPHGLMQARAACVSGRVARLRIFRRDTTRVSATAAEWKNELGVEVVPARSIPEAIAGVPIIILATTSTSPVINATDALPGAYVASLGPKSVASAELPIELVQGGRRVVTDAPEQSASDPGFLGHSAGHLIPLASDLSFKPRGESGVTFLSQGLAGTEVAVAHALALAYRSRQQERD